MDIHHIQAQLVVAIVFASSASATENDNVTGRAFSGQFSGTAAQIDNFDPHDYVPAHYSKVRVAHAVLMSAVWLIIFPIGAIVPRLMDDSSLGLVKVHATMQMIGFWIVLGAAAMGVWMGQQIDQESLRHGQTLSHYHPVLGLLLLGLLCVQPATEILNHHLYHKYPKMIFTAYVHLWLGRGLLVAGAIQGGLGFLFAAGFKKASVDTGPRIAYAATAITVWVFYLCVGIIYPEFAGSWRKRRTTAPTQAVVVEEMENSRTDSFAAASLWSTPGWVTYFSVQRSMLPSVTQASMVYPSSIHGNTSSPIVHAPIAYQPSYGNVSSTTRYTPQMQPHYA